MSERKVFCEECRNDVTYTINKKEMSGTVKDREYFYLGKEAHCKDCETEIYVAEVNDFNLRALYDEYRRENNIVSLDVILAIPKKYAIGKRPLSLLLGWGEHTFSRYCDGDMPTKQYADILQRLYNDPVYYAEMLENNKENLKATASYEKSKKAVNELLGITDKSKTKINMIIEYLLSQCEDITQLSLQKALYYIQGFYYAFYNSFLFPEDCEAWVHGPVYRDVYNRYHINGFDPIEKNIDFNSSVFSSSEKAIIDSVINNICCYSGKVLEAFTHSETPWLSTRGELPPTAASNRTIKKELIGTYFCAVKEKYNMINTNDIKSYARKMFEQI